LNEERRANRYGFGL
nr:callatostatin 2=neuropeptide [Calliphora vomitoria=blowflies, heads, Peptide, 14 aa] [Calliphora vomitoria]